MYILKISSNAFIKQKLDGETVIINDPNKAMIFDKIGDAMKIAAQINENLETNKVQVISL